MKIDYKDYASTYPLHWFVQHLEYGKTNEYRRWCNGALSGTEYNFDSNAGDWFVASTGVASFKNESDAVLFMLTWS